MKRLTIKEILDNYTKHIHHDICIQGWVRAFRSNRFIALSDGSTANNIQIVVDFEKFDEEIIKKIHTASSLKVTGEVVESQGAGQNIEVLAKKIESLGDNFTDELEKTVLQPKKHSLELLREQAHLRFRTNLFGAVFRIRHAVSFAIHQFFNQNQFFYIHTPLITGADAEGPTFRAENSNTTRQLAEFWMVEPEVAVNNLEDNIDLAEDFLKYVINYVLDNCKDDLELLDKRFAEEQKQKPEKERAAEGLIEKLQNVVKKRFVRLSYTEAIEILLNSKENKKGKFQFPIEAWGADLQSEHERYLVEKHFESPVVLFNYPKDIKAFYMKLNDDQKTVAAMDVLFPGIGEIIGGSQREEKLDVLVQKMKDMNVDEEELWWYLDTRKFGSVPHAGFGLGLERLVLFVTGMTNIRDVIPFPRTPRNAEF